MEYGYIRFSSERQEGGSSVARQLKLIKEACPTIDENNIFKDLGVSAFTGDNQASGSNWYKLVEIVKQGDTIYVEMVDRISRQGIDNAIEVIRTVRDKGVTVVTTSDRKEYKGGCDTQLTEIITLSVAAELAKNESLNKSKRIKESYQTRFKKVEKGEPVKINTVSWIDYKNASYQLNDKAGTVREILNLYKQGFGASLIAIELNGRGIKTFRRGGQWKANTILSILDNKALYGEYRGVKDYFPAVISENEYWEIQEQKRVKRADRVTKVSRGYFNVWQGLLYCELCASKMHLILKGKHRYYVCLGKVNTRKCQSKNIKVEVAERMFREFLALSNSKELVAGAPIDTKSLEIEITKLQIEHQDIENWIDKNGFVATVADRLVVVKQKLKELQEALGKARSEVKVKSGFAYIRANLKLETREDRYRANMYAKKIVMLTSVISREKGSYWSANGVADGGWLKDWNQPKFNNHSDNALASLREVPEDVKVIRIKM